jgi:hypothetical protein
MALVSTISKLTSTQVPTLNDCSSQSLLNYFHNSWEIEETLMKSLIGEETFYLNPDPLRNPLIFYLGSLSRFFHQQVNWRWFNQSWN